MRRLSALVCGFVVVLASCRDSGAPRSSADDGTPEPLPRQYFTITGRIALEENRDVINVAPFVAPRGDADGFLIVDQREARTRLYAADGRLVRQFGRRGRGPGEFQRPIAGAQTPSGRLVVADMANGLLQFSAHDSLLSSARPQLTPMYGAVAVSDSIVLLAGRGTAPAGQRAPLLHLWSLERGEVVRSFFPTPGDSIQRLAARNFGWVGTALRGDTIAAVFSLSDTLYLFNTQGQPLGTVPLAVRGFTPVRELPEGRGDDPVELNRWMGQFRFLNSVFPMPDGSYLVQYERPEAMESRWNLLRVDARGRVVWDLTDTPRLMAAQNGRLYFQDPQAEAPNRWIVAQLRA